MGRLPAVGERVMRAPFVVEPAGYNSSKQEAGRGCRRPGRGTTTDEVAMHSESIRLCACGCGRAVPTAQYPSLQRRYLHNHHLAVPLEQRFWEKVAKRGPDECWEWQAARRQSYGVIRVAGKTRLAHRLALEIALGRPLAPGAQALHSCDNPPCCNPAHLHEGDAALNMAEMSSRGRHWAKRRPDKVLRGESHGRALLTWDLAREIRRRAAAGERGAEIARALGFRKNVIYRVLSGSCWVEPCV